MANDSFIAHRCQICSGTDIADMALSEVIVNAGYGSKHDGQQLRLLVCGKCVDMILSGSIGKNSMPKK